MTRPHKCNLFALHFFAGVALFGCSGGGFPFAQPLEVEQGNVIDREQIDALQLGMNPAQVRRTIGEPVLEPTLSEGRWDYLYRHSGARLEPKSRRLSLFFEDGQLSKIDDEWEDD